MQPMITKLVEMDTRVQCWAYHGNWPSGKSIFVQARYIGMTDLSNEHELFDVQDAHCQVIVTTIDTWAMRHGVAAGKRWVENSVDLMVDAWPFDMEDKFGLCVIDEAHFVKDPETERNAAIYALDAEFTLLSSATIFPNCASADILGYLRLIENRDCSREWATAISLDSAFNPFSEQLPDQSRKLLVSADAAKRLIAGCNDPGLVAFRVVAALRHCMIRRLYGSPSPAGSGFDLIGDSLPSIVYRSITAPFSKDAAVMHAKKAKEYLAFLYMPTDDGSITLNGRYLRRLHLISTDPRLSYIESGLMAGSLGQWRSTPEPLYCLIKRMHRAIKLAHPTDPEPFALPQSTDIPSLAAELMRYSPKCRELVRIILNHVLFDNQKVLVVTANPGSQILVTALIKAYGVHCVMFASDLKVVDRNLAISEF